MLSLAKRQRFPPHPFCQKRLEQFLLLQQHLLWQSNRQL
jgi:hypothetical protein